MNKPALYENVGEIQSQAKKIASTVNDFITLYTKTLRNMVTNKKEWDKKLATISEKILSSVGIFDIFSEIGNSASIHYLFLLFQQPQTMQMVTTFMDNAIKFHDLVLSLYFDNTSVKSHIENAKKSSIDNFRILFGCGKHIDDIQNNFMVMFSKIKDFSPIYLEHLKQRQKTLVDEFKVAKGSKKELIRDDFDLVTDKIKIFPGVVKSMNNFFQEFRTKYIGRC